MIGYKVSLNKECLSYRRPTEQYGDWSEEYENTFESIRLATRKDFSPDLVSTLDLKTGDECFVVWVEWSTGDSFGWAKNGDTEAIGVFKDKTSARELKQALESFKPDPDVDDYEEKYKFKLTTSDGQRFQIDWVPWCNFFEKLEEVHIDSATLD